MAVYIRRGSTTYTHDVIKSVTFTPEVDMRLETLPVCQFSAEIVTDESDDELIGATVSLCHDTYSSTFYDNYAIEEVLASCYIIVEVSRISKHVVSILAKNVIYALQKRELAPSFIAYSDFYGLTDDLFNGPTTNDNADQLDPGFGQFNIGGRFLMNGICSAETAYERLRKLCQACGIVITQWGFPSFSGNGTSFAYRYYPDYESKTPVLIPMENTFKDPKITKNAAVKSVIRKRYYNHTLVDHSGDDNWVKLTIQESADLGNGLIIEGQVAYAQTVELEANNPSIDEIGEYILIESSTIQGQYNNIVQANAYFRHYEVELDVLYFPTYRTSSVPIQDNLYEPGRKVRFYVNPTTIYEGYIKSANYHFGKAERLTLVISTDLQPVQGFTLKFVYEYSGRKLGEREYYYPDGYSYSVTHPNISVDVVGTTETFSPLTATSTGTLNSNTTITIQYTRS